MLSILTEAVILQSYSAMVLIILNLLSRRKREVVEDGALAEAG